MVLLAGEGETLVGVGTWEGVFSHSVIFGVANMVFLRAFLVFLGNPWLGVLGEGGIDTYLGMDLRGDTTL